MSSLAEANRVYFSAISDTYDHKPWYAELNQQIVDTMASRLDWVGIPLANVGPNSQDTKVRLLDYACGTGHWSRIFNPYVTTTRGIDIAPGMVNTYNTRAQQLNLYPDKVSAVLGDLTSKTELLPPQLTEPEYFNFDIVTVGFAFHHFEDVVHTARMLKERLRPGGVLVFNDFVSGGDLLADEDGKPIPGSEGDHSHKHDHAHHHGHKHNDEHHHGHHDHSHSHSHSPNKATDATGELTQHGKEIMKQSIKVYSFTIDGVKEFLTEAGFVDIDVFVQEKKAYMEFAGMKIFRTVFFARGRRPLEEEEGGKSEL